MSLEVLLKWKPGLSSHSVRPAPWRSCSRVKPIHGLNDQLFIVLFFFFFLSKLVYKCFFCPHSTAAAGFSLPMALYYSLHLLAILERKYLFCFIFSCSNTLIPFCTFRKVSILSLNPVGRFPPACRALLLLTSQRLLPLLPLIMLDSCICSHFHPFGKPFLVKYIIPYFVCNIKRNKRL